MTRQHFSETAPFLALCQVDSSLLRESFGPDPPPALRIHVRNCGIKWNHCLDGQHKTLSRLMSGSPFIILVSTFGSSGTARTKASESAQKSVLEGVLKKDNQQNRPALRFITGNTVGENHRGHHLYRISWEMSEIMPSFLQSHWFWDATRTSKLYECISLPSGLRATDDISKNKSILKWMRST